MGKIKGSGPSSGKKKKGVDVLLDGTVSWVCWTSSRPKRGFVMAWLGLMETTKEGLLD